MKCLNFYKNGIYLQFCIDDENRLLINHIGTEKGNLTGNSFLLRQKYLLREKIPTIIMVQSIRETIF